MNIEFYLNDEEQTEITIFYNLQSNPFKLGDEINLDVEELFPVDYNKYNIEFQNKLFKNNKELRDKFRLKKIKLIEENKYVSFKLITEPKLVIEYFCEFIEC